MNAMYKIHTGMLLCALSCTRTSLSAPSLTPIVLRTPLNRHTYYCTFRRYVRLLNGRLRLKGSAAADDDIPDPIRRAPLLGPIF